MKEVLHEAETSVAKPRWDFEASIREALGELPSNQFANLEALTYEPKRGVSSIPQAQHASFREEFLAFAQWIDEHWKESWKRQFGQPFNCETEPLANYALVSKYLQRVRALAKGGGFRTLPNRWISPEVQGGWYDPTWLTERIKELLRKASGHYASRPDLDEFHLLLHYDRAVFLNAPAVGVDLDFVHHARAVAEFLKQEPPRPFDRVFLFIAVEPDPEVFMLYLGPRVFLRALYYELWMLNETADLEQKLSPGVEHNAALESFLVHYRCLLAFALGKDNHPTDIRLHGFPGAREPDTGEPERQEFKRVSQHLAHLTEPRVEGIEKWDVEALRRRTNEMMRGFFESIDRDQYPRDRPKSEFIKLLENPRLLKGG